MISSPALLLADPAQYDIIGICSLCNPATLAPTTTIDENAIPSVVACSMYCGSSGCRPRSHPNPPRTTLKRRRSGSAAENVLLLRARSYFVTLLHRLSLVVNDGSEHEPKHRRINATVMNSPPGTCYKGTRLKANSHVDSCLIVLMLPLHV